jgi:deazaflavin-dependent oxidoreductase (nitroreductase family)
MPSDFALKAMNAGHRAIVKLSFGRIGWSASGMPALELTTIGRKSGQPHAVMLTAPLQEGAAVVDVASRGGDDKPPAWLLNLQANPAVEVSLQGRPRQPMHARVATGEERARMWPQIAGRHKNYAGYQRRTERQIALVLLEPAPS